MRNSIRRSLYRLVLELHPPLFRRRFGSEMLDTYEDLSSERHSQTKLLLDVSRSVVRQWAAHVPCIRRNIAAPSLPAANSLLEGDYPAIATGRPPTRRILQSGFVVAVLTLTLANLTREHRLVRPPMEYLAKIHLGAYPSQADGKLYRTQAPIQPPVSEAAWVLRPGPGRQVQPWIQQP